MLLLCTLAHWKVFTKLNGTLINFVDCPCIMCAYVHHEKDLYYCIISSKARGRKFAISHQRKHDLHHSSRLLWLNCNDKGKRMRTLNPNPCCLCMKVVLNKTVKPILLLHVCDRVTISEVKKETTGYIWWPVLNTLPLCFCTLCPNIVRSRSLIKHHQI